MITGINLDETVDFIVSTDKENPTVWKIGAISSIDMAKVASAYNENEYMMRVIDVTRIGLKGWTNFQIAGKEVPYQADGKGVLESLIKSIPLQVLSEIGAQIIKQNNLTIEETKN